MATSPLAFVGISQFSQDFQTILDRQVKIASVPIQRLQQDQVDLLGRKQLLTNLNGAVATLGSTLADLGQVGAEKALYASSSDAAIVSVTYTGASAPATYTISDITSIAHAASATTAGYANSTATPVSATGSVRLSVNGQEYNLTLTAQENNLTGLRDKINNLGAGVTATVLTTGTGANPYYLSITANANGHKPITLVDDPTGTPVSLLATVDDGANTEFKINGAAVSKSGTLINDVVPGITFNILDTTSGSETVTLTLASDRSRLQSSLESFVAQYNSVVFQVDAQVGSAAGLLTGNFLVREVAGALRQVASYRSSSGTVQGLADLGIEFDSQGKASFNQTTFDTLSETNIQDAFTLLGSESSGLGALASKFTQLSDPVIGLIKVEQDQYDKTDKALTDQVAILTERVSVLRLSVTAKLQAADALLAGLESQQRVLDASIQSLNVTLYGKNE